MQLGRLSGMERDKIEEEYQALVVKIEDLRSILADESKVLEIIKNDLTDIKNKYGYSSYDIAMVKYVLTSIFYEFSKLIIFGIFFGFLGYFKSFLVSLILLLFLRINIGGIHCKHYITCFLLTFVVLFSSIILLPIRD